jgi:hypothetical protein
MRDMDRSNHYEAAFEAYLQEHRLPYVAVDESRRALLGGLPVKSLDFVVYGDGGSRLVVDVKGRRFPGGKPKRPRRVWESWSTREDVESLERWATLFGPDYQGVLVFAYHLAPTVELPDETPDVWCWRGRRYLLRGVTAADYRREMRVRSTKWGTVHLPVEVFRELVRPLSHFTNGPPVEAEAPF